MRKLITFAIGLFVAAGTTANSAAIKIISARAAGLILGVLAPQFEQTTGNKVTISMTRRALYHNVFLSGEVFDVTFLPAGWDEVRGKLASAFHRQLGPPPTKQ